MFICENCGTSHTGSYGSGRFCSTKCSRGFSTKAKRKEINEQVKKTFKIKNDNKIILPKFCISCEAELLGNTHKKYCTECSDFLKYRVLFKKLNIQEKNIKIANNKVFIILYNEYFNNDLCLGQLKEKYKIQFNTMYFYFLKNGIHLRNNSDAGSLAVSNGRLSPQSNTIYKHGKYETWEGKKVYLRSSYEFNYAKELDEKHISYDVESKRIKYFDQTKLLHRIAIPDFFLIDSNMLVEIKSSYTLNLENMKDKFIAYDKLGYKTKLIVDGKEIKIKL